MIDSDPTHQHGPSTAHRRGRRVGGGRGAGRGQIIVLFALMIVAIIGIVGLVVDVSWFWVNSLRVQRAADAAALAGVVYLPGQTATGVAVAKGEAKMNGYTDGVGGVTVTPVQDAALKTQLNVTVTAPVGTFFARVFGIDTFTATRTAKAQFQLPVPMGSPENYYGTYCLTTPSNRTCATGTALVGANGTTVFSKGFWGAIQATGTDHAQGDAYTPLDDRTRSLGKNGSGGTNPDFDPSGYNYAIELPAGGNIYVFDPTACAVGDQLGSGDHWNDANPAYSVSTFYDLYNTNATPNTLTDDTLVASSANLFRQEYQYDQSGTYGTPSYSGNIKPTSKDGRALRDCREGITAVQSDSRFWHDKWWAVGQGVAAGSPGVATGLPAGTYRLNVRSAALGSPNQAATFENDWSIESTGACKAGACPKVYGLGRMAGYNILTSGTQTFYLAQIGPENAGKTLQIILFDPGDVSGPAFMRILDPDGNAYNLATFSYTADGNCGQTNGSSDVCSASGRTQITTADKNGKSSFNDSWITINIPLSSTYGCSVAAPCLKPAGETQQGWWKIEYQVTGGNDTTTWMVNILGNPVHLVLP
jgi:Flp pilus assembly protein TadG